MKAMIFKGVFALLILMSCTAAKYGRNGKLHHSRTIINRPVCLGGRYKDYRRRIGKPTELCSCVDISRERDFSNVDLLNKVWYVHMQIDFSDSIATDMKLVHQFDIGGKNVIGYSTGRTKTGECNNVVFQDIQVGVNRPCHQSKTLVPAELTPPWEWTNVMFDDAKTQVLFYTCQDVVKHINKCDNIIVFAATSRPNLLPGEKELFEAKITEFGGKGHVPPGGLPIQRPTSNNCEDANAKGLGIRA